MITTGLYTSNKYCLKLIIAGFLFLTTFSAQAQQAKKFLFPWVIYDSTCSFAAIDPYKHIIKSVSIFGNPSAAFIDTCHENNIEVYHAVGGSENDLSSPQKIESLVNNYVEDCRSNGYDGIDIDFEALNPSLRPTYSVFLKKLSDKLHNQNKKLSHCVGFYPTFYVDSGKHYFYDPEIIAQTCDLVRVMCYDMYYAPGKNSDSTYTADNDPGVGPTSTAPFTRDAMRFWLRYVAPQKLVMGLPAYSNDYVLSAQHISGEQVYKPYPDNEKNISAPTWLWLEKLNLYVYADSTDRTHMFYASDDKSTKALLDVGAELMLNNIGFWHLASISDKTWQVLEQWPLRVDNK